MENINIPFLFALGTIWYLSPIFIAIFFIKARAGLFFSTIFLGRTPLPRILLVMYMIEDSNEKTKNQIETLRKELSINKINQ